MDRKTQLKKLRKITDDQIDFSDLPDIEDGLEWKPNSFFKSVSWYMDPEKMRVPSSIMDLK